jgi:hypothetical protein
MNVTSLFQEAGKQAIIDRFLALQPEQQAQWGKMNVAQMLAHCQKPIAVALGTAPLENSFKLKLIKLLFGKMVKKKLLQEGPLQKNAPTAQSFIVQDNCQFEQERTQLLSMIATFAQRGNQGQLEAEHPIFGKMTLAEWDLLQWKHLDHHLKQFGA